jgi:hypothetical protein
MYMLLMVLHVLQESEDVINVINHKIIQILIKNNVHHMLKDNSCVNKTKWHHNIFKIVVMGFERCIPFFVFSNVHQVICST